MKIKVQPLDTALEIAQQFIETVISPPLQQVGELFADTVRAWRLKNQINIVIKAEKMLKEAGVKTKKVSLKQLAPLLESGSLEEDEFLQEKWAALLANTVDENSTIKSNFFSSILRELTTEDAVIFNAIFERCTVRDSDGQNITIVRNPQHVISTYSFKDYADTDLAFDNLKRLRLIREILPYDSNGGPVVLSELGFKFMIACSWPR